MTYRLYGTPGSLYTGKVRSYLIRNGIRFENRAAGSADFRERIVPQIGRWIIPVLETPEGELIQDGSDIIDWFEARRGDRQPASPETPRHALISQIFELFGGEGLLRPAMHYRWNFDEINRPFLERDFSAFLAPTGADDETRQGVFAMSSSRMRKAMASFGVSAETIPAIETAYLEFLDLFDRHLSRSPFLLGGRPTIGDWGLIAPLYAHLARDPYPSAIMKTRAHRVWRWVERMNASDPDVGEYVEARPELFPDDEVPDTLLSLLRFVATDYLPEVEAFVTFANRWLAERPDMPAWVSGLDRPQDRVIGQVDYLWRGLPVRVGVLPYRLYLLQKVQEVWDRTSGPDREALDGLLQDTGLSSFVRLRTARKVVRRNHLEVWAPAT